MVHLFLLIQCVFSSDSSWINFQEDFNNLADEIHNKNKAYFFDMLSPELLEKLGAEYDQ